MKRETIVGEIVASLTLLFVLNLSMAGPSTFNLVSPVFGDGVTISGTVTTDGTIGSLSAANFTQWNIVVKQTVDTVFTPANSRNFSTGVSTDGSLVSVSNPDGSLYFYGGHYGNNIQLADFTYSPQALFQRGTYVVTRSLPNTNPYTAGDLLSHSPNADIFSVKPLNMGEGIKVTGTLTSDGTIGDLNLTDWNILVRQVTTQVFNETNSNLMGMSDLVSSDGKVITVDNPDGFLGFGSGNEYGPYIALADFTYGSNEARFQGFTFSQTVDPLTGEARYVAATVVPAPGALILAGVGMIAVRGLTRRRMI
jgi:hypothetical protein